MGTRVNASVSVTSEPDDSGAGGSGFGSSRGSAGGNVYDAASLCWEHDREGLAHAVEGRGQIQLKLILEVLVGDVFERAVE